MAVTDVGEAEQRRQWRSICDELPELPWAYFSAVITTRKLGETALAEAFAGFAVEHFPNGADLHLEYCRTADRRQDHEVALVRWLAATQQAPYHPALPFGLADVLMRLGRHAEAEPYLDRAMETFASNFNEAVADGWIKGLAIKSAECATILGRPADASRRWTALLERFPGDGTIEHHYRAAVTQMNMASIDGISAPGSVVERLAVSAADTPAQDLMLAFESLGDSCEFGLLQRHYSVEPLGLLRWVSIAARPLVTLLETGFAGVGDPEYARMHIDPAQEYITTDTRYGMAMHTFVNAAGQDEAKLFAQMCRRAQFLARKLTEDLRAGEKIFVYRGSVSLTEAEILAVDQAVKAYNPNNALLIVTIPAGSQATGKLEQLGERLMVAAIRGGRRVPIEAGWDVDVTTWRAVCTRTYEAFCPGRLG